VRNLNIFFVVPFGNLYNVRGSRKVLGFMNAAEFIEKFSLEANKRQTENLLRTGSKETLARGENRVF
jgi:hypothetical protein